MALKCPFIDCEHWINPLVLGSKWCFNSGNPFCLATSMLASCFLGVKRVPSQNRSIYKMVVLEELVSIGQGMIHLT